MSRERLSWYIFGAAVSVVFSVVAVQVIEPDLDNYATVYYALPNTPPTTKVGMDQPIVNSGEAVVFNNIGTNSAGRPIEVTVYCGVAVTATPLGCGTKQVLAATTTQYTLRLFSKSDATTTAVVLFSVRALLTTQNTINRYAFPTIRPLPPVTFAMIPIPAIGLSRGTIIAYRFSGIAGGKDYTYDPTFVVSLTGGAKAHSVTLRTYRDVSFTLLAGLPQTQNDVFVSSPSSTAQAKVSFASSTIPANTKRYYELRTIVDAAPSGSTFTSRPILGHLPAQTLAR